MFSLIKQWKLTDLTVKNIVSTDDSVKRQITDSISGNLTDSDLESTVLNIKKVAINEYLNCTIFLSSFYSWFPEKKNLFLLAQQWQFSADRVTIIFFSFFKLRFVLEFNFWMFFMKGSFTFCRMHSNHEVTSWMVELWLLNGKWMKWNPPSIPEAFRCISEFNRNLSLCVKGMKYLFLEFY